MTLENGAVVAIVRVDDGGILATAAVDKFTDRDVRTETPYDQRSSRNERARRYWKATDPHTEIRVPREEKSTRAPCFVRLATHLDIAEAQRLANVRRARERMPRNLRSKEEYERRISLIEASLRRKQKPYERLLKEIADDLTLLGGTCDE